MTVILICGIPIAWLVGIHWGVRYGYHRAIKDMRDILRRQNLFNREGM